MNALQTLATAAFTLVLAGSINLAAAETVADMSHDSMAMPPAATRNTHEGVGVLEAVNAKAGKVQISHEAISSLNWPAMTMWFTLHTTLPKDLKAGDRIRFELAQQGNRWDVTRIERR